VPAPPNRVRAMIGYHLAWEHNIIGMAMTQGRQREVVYIGMAIKRLQVEPREATILAYAQSFYHKVVHRSSHPIFCFSLLPLKKKNSINS
jgi:4'-phosphopantetheinyl transferase